MKKIFSAFCCLFFAVAAFAQTPTPKPVETDADVVKISTTLIQVDATVTDKNGRVVTDLTADDFEIFENDKKQSITNFSFVSSVPAIKPVVNPDKNRAGVPIPPVELRPEQVRRTIALVVDDLGLSAESVYFVKRALRKFVDEQMQPADLVAIVRTGSGTGALQQFTSDKNLLYLAIEKLRWNPLGRAGVTTFAPREPTLQELVKANSAIPSRANVSAGQMDPQIEAEKERITAFNELREDIFSIGTLGAINYIVRGMNELPGRKSIMLFSDGFSICTDTDMKKDGGRCTRMREALKQLTDLCNRASVTIYTQDARGIAPTALTVQDVPTNDPKSLLEGLNARTNELRDKQQGLNFLAEETGGRAILGTNDLNKGLEKLLEDTKGYYLIAYQPDSETFDNQSRRFNKLVIKVRRDDVNVRYRSGFFGVPESAISRAAAQNETPLQQILKPLTSPFAANEINLKLNTLFGRDDKNGAFLHSFLHVDARDLKFSEAADGTKQATFDVLAISYGENGAIVDQVGKNYTIAVKSEEYQKILNDGFVYNFVFPIRQPGAYQMRAALRDAGSAKVGSASQFIEVPDLKKERLTLSGIILENLTETEWKNRNSAPAPSQNQTRLMQDTSLRRFRRGTILNYSADIYNARLDAAQKTQLQTQIRIFRDGKLVLDGQPKPFQPEGNANPTRLNFAGALGLGNEMKPGDYVLQIIVTDNLAKSKGRLATQWVQFELTD
ncbi:MAG TPA: VWA domain-containing protein [Pyrinomonadaceae bacterium]|jgi:VWFA-related protein